MLWLPAAQVSYRQEQNQSLGNPRAKIKKVEAAGEAPLGLAFFIGDGAGDGVHLLKSLGSDFYAITIGNMIAQRYRERQDVFIGRSDSHCRFLP